MDKHVIHHDKSFTIYSTSIGEDQIYVTALTRTKDIDPVSTCKEVYRQIAKTLKQMGFQIVQERIFGSNSIQTVLLKDREDIMHEYGIYEEFPVTYIQGLPVWGDGFSGVQIYALKPSRPNNRIWTIYEGKIPCGRGWKRNGATFLMLQNIHGLQKESSNDNSREEQTIRMFNRANTLLHQQGATYRNVIRTWIYLSKILDWYGTFNQIRNTKYKEFNLIPVITNGIMTEQIYLPASTGIEGDNPLGAIAIMDLLAVMKEPDAQLEIIQNTGSKQRSPYRYGSAFSRSIVIQEPESKMLYISGTASIDEQGKSLFSGKPREQIRRTLDTIDALIKQEGASLQNICQATIFLKRQEDISMYHEVAKSYGLSEIPAICVIADICRDELLFEIDALVTL